jgi:hypothetical protein
MNVKETETRNTVVTLYEELLFKRMGPLSSLRVHIKKGLDIKGRSMVPDGFFQNNSIYKHSST